MGCECISPPPEFDIPPPPDPSLIWHLISDELANELIQIQQCETDQKATSHSEVISVFPSLPDYLLYALLASGALITAALLIGELVITNKILIHFFASITITKTIDLISSAEKKCKQDTILALAKLSSLVVICIF
ncbi:unnamed protein product [Onchocerca flexuosa]|uniref:G_PROTEIN_RECEP_F1_2 domain-containing protein n=1 Tax=Onchocerca flexuosa TaxID=387005 RepID=A0A183H501_9BILA|nr:unnamed protein product [Onchocerca flexuosa]